jgi:hypothetical protein
MMSILRIARFLRFSIVIFIVFGDELNNSIRDVIHINNWRFGVTTYSMKLITILLSIYIIQLEGIEKKLEDNTFC